MRNEILFLILDKSAVWEEVILGRKQALNFTFDSVTASFPIGKKWLPLPSPVKVSNARSSQPNTILSSSGFSNSNIQRYWQGPKCRGEGEIGHVLSLALSSLLNIVPAQCPTTWNAGRIKANGLAFPLRLPSSLWQTCAQINGIILLPIFLKLGGPIHASELDCLVDHVSELIFSEHIHLIILQKLSRRVRSCCLLFLYFERAEYWCFELLWIRNVNSQKKL